jgi:hypothetical protein
MIRQQPGAIFMQRKVRLVRRRDVPVRNAMSLLDRISVRDTAIKDAIRLRAKIELLNEDQIKVLEDLVESFLS